MYNYYMMYNFNNTNWWGMMGPGASTWFLPALSILVIWSLFWKGLALWHAARRGENIWFIVLLILNTAGIAEIIYLFLFAKIKWANLFSKNSR